MAGHVAAVSVGASFAAGAWVGLALGVVVGALIGALVSWFAGAVLDWQRDLAFTVGLTRGLLPFGDQVPALRWLAATWYLVIPMAALAFGLLAAVVGALVGALVAAAYNRSPRHVSVVVELPAEWSQAAEHPGRAVRGRPR